MTLASPVWLAAAASVIVPILIHLFGRPRPRLHRFPSLMLLRRVRRERRSTTRIRRIVSLILRCLALMLLALVLAGPRSDRALLARLGEPLGLTAIVLDTSPSMDARLDAGRPIDRAREAALAVLDALPDGEEVVVRESGGRPASVLPVADAERLIAGMALSDRRARLGDDIASTLDGDRPIARVFVATDLQATSLGALPAAPDTPAQAIVLDAGGEVVGNSALTGVDADAPVLVRGRPVELTVQARTWGAGQGRVPVTVECAGESATTGIDLFPDARATATLEGPAPDAGLLACTARLPADAMPADDESVFAALVRERLRVAVIGPEREARFIEAALDPWPEGDPRSEIEVVRPDALSGDADLDAVIFASGAATEGELDALHALSERGTGMMLFATASPAMLDAAGFGGVTLGDARRREDGAALAELVTDRAPLADFADPGAGDLTAARFTTLPRVTIADDADVSVIARYDDGTPALVEGARGRARTLLFATSSDDAWGDLVRMPEFVPLMHRLATHLTAGTEAAILAGAPGEPTVFAVSSFAGRVSSPSAVGSDGSSIPVQASADAWQFVAPARAAYEVRSGEEEIAACAVNLDAAESDPARLTDAEVRERLRPMAAQVVEASALDAFLARLRPDAADVSSLIALLALLVLAIEGVQSLGASAPRGSSDDERGER